MPEEDPSALFARERMHAGQLAAQLGLRHVVPADWWPALEQRTCIALQIVPLGMHPDGIVELGTTMPLDDETAVEFAEDLLCAPCERVVVAPCDFDALFAATPTASPPTVPTVPAQSLPTTPTAPPDLPALPPLAQPTQPTQPTQPNEPTEFTTAAAAEAPRQSPQPLRLGELLVETGVLHPRSLRHALALQQRTGLRLGTLLLNHGLVDAESLARGIGQQTGAPYVDRAELHVNPQVASLLPEATCRRHRVLPLDISDHRLRVAMVDPLDDHALAALATVTRLPIEPCVTTEAAIVDALRALHRDAQSDISVYGLLNRRPDESAHVVLSEWQKVFLIAAPLALMPFLAWQPINTLITLFALSSAFYTAFAIFKIRAVVASLSHDSGLWISDEEAAAIPERDLPIYTILVPLYKETEVLGRLVKGMTTLDYPVSKLDVKLLLEEDDVETVEAARAMDLPACVDVVVTPDSQPKTKPKSCNYGLLYARGEYTVIFDAEDVPEPNQLRKAVAAFRKCPPNVVCLQAMLNYYNRSQNSLTKWFTGEYSGWFDMLVPGLDRLNLPIPLGGTSNHFVTDVLVELGAWDPFNVTEDADLGIRLAHAGYKTAHINSTTYEEANSETFNWIRQRSRWVKGYIQTWLVHMRDPIGMIEGVGVRDFIGFQLVIGGTFMVFLLNPLYWIVLLLWTLTHAQLIRDVLPPPMYYISAVSFMFGNFVFVYINALAAIRRSYWDLLFSSLTSPVYWMLMSIAAWRGLIQLITAPSYWEKTEHGLDGESHDTFAAQQAMLNHGSAPK